MAFIRLILDAHSELIHSMVDGSDSIIRQFKIGYVTKSFAFLGYMHIEEMWVNVCSFIDISLFYFHDKTTHRPLGNKVISMAISKDVKCCKGPEAL